MDVLIAYGIGAVMGSVATFLVARNNRKKFNEAMDINPKAKWYEMVEDLKGRIK